MASDNAKRPQLPDRGCFVITLNLEQPRVVPWKSIGWGRDAIVVWPGAVEVHSPAAKVPEMIRHEAPKSGGGNAAGAAGPLVSLPYLTAGKPPPPRSRLRIYPSGIELEEITKPKRRPPETEKTRGEILGYSAKSAMRFREFSMTHHVPHSTPYGCTLTDRADTGPDDWRRYLDMMNKRLTRFEWAATWRIELHATGKKCGLPHVHPTIWAPNELPAPDVYHWLVKTWLEVIGKTGDLACRRHAVSCKPIESSGWFAYQAAHDSKHKQEQLGWKGKQWGIWNRSKFERIVPDEVQFTDAQDKLFRRWFNRLLLRRGAKIRAKCEGNFRRLGTARSMYQLVRWVLENAP